MKLTCVTATFNCIKSGNRDCLVRCIESVSRLKTEHEHLIYDGASTDGTAELLRELEAKTPGLKVVSEPDTGIYNALNKGVRDAQGEWFYVIGADDYVSHPDVMDRLLSEEDENTDVIVAEVERDSGFGFFHSMKDFETIFCHVPCSHQGIITKTKVVREFGGFNEKDYKICADWEMMHKGHAVGLKHHYVFEPFAFYASGGASERLDGPVIVEMRRVIERQLGLYGEAANRYWAKGYPPWNIIIELINHKDEAYKLAGKMYLGRMIKAYLRIVLYPVVILRRFARK